MDLDVFRLFIYYVAASVVFCFYSFLENHHGGECDCSGRPLPHVLNSRFVSEKLCILLYLWGLEVQKIVFFVLSSDHKL